MDVNKLEALRGAGYRIPPTCGLCVHARLAPGQAYGTCRAIPYEHAKHSGPPREASIWRGGVCDKFESGGPGALERALGGFAALFVEESRDAQA